MATDRQTDRDAQACCWDDDLPTNKRPIKLPTLRV